MKKLTHKVRVGRESFTVDVRYQQLRLIGRGAYGSVVGAMDTITGEQVAIKRVKDVFDDEHRVKAKRILREIKLLRHFRHHENILHVRDMFAMPQDDDANFDEICIVCNLMETDLDQIINSPQDLTEQHHQYFLYQVLRGLKYVHSADVVHRDLKPSNLLLNANCDLALCDFGLSRGLSGADEDGLTEYVVTRWYRAPELLCEAPMYGKAVDVWSIGCIFAELLTRKPFFQGKNPQHQLSLIVEIVGCPPAAELGFASHPAARDTIERARAGGPSGLESRLPPDVRPEALDLLSKMLVVRPEDRIAVEGALAHPYLEELHSQMEEPSCPAPFDGSFESSGEGDIRRMMLEEMARLRREGGASANVSAEESMDMNTSG